MALDTALSNVIIEDNVFDYGLFATDTSLSTIPTTYGYASCIFTNSDAKITGNYFGAAINGSTQIITNGTASCMITNNTFVRGTTSIAAYINASASFGDQVIVDNIFDSPTVDGFNETLVQLIPVTSVTPTVIYERNKNQTAFKQIQKSPYLTSFTSQPGFNLSEWAGYVDNSTTISPSNPALNHPFNGTFFKQEGVAANYSTPFNPLNAIRMSGLFHPQNGDTTVLVDSPLPVQVTSSFTGSPSLPFYIMFGNDNVYYEVIATSTTSGGAITQLVMTTPYTGPTDNAMFATFFPIGGFLQTTLGSYAITGGTSSITIAGALGLVTIGSVIHVNDGTAATYRVTSVSSSSISISPSYGGSTGTYVITTGSTVLAANFSVNLSEVLPSNVKVVSTVFGIWGNNNINPSGNSTNVTPLITADYNAFMHMSSGTQPYANNLTNLTFTLVTNSATVTASATPVGLSIGSAICFSPQSDFVYPISNIVGTTITLGVPYVGAPSTIATAVYFDNTMADASNYSIVSGTSAAFGNPISMVVGGGSGIDKNVFAAHTQYLKIDPSDPLISNGFPYFTGSGILLRYNLNITINMATVTNNGSSIVPSSMFLPESPLIVKYRW